MENVEEEGDIVESDGESIIDEEEEEDEDVVLPPEYEESEPEYGEDDPIAAMVMNASNTYSEDEEGHFPEGDFVEDGVEIVIAEEHKEEVKQDPSFR